MNNPLLYNTTPRADSTAMSALAVYKCGNTPKVTIDTPKEKKISPKVTIDTPKEKERHFDARKNINKFGYLLT